jgi:hypothetical protein
MQLFHRYKTQFQLQTNTLSIADLFQHPTIIGHAQLIREILDNTQNIDDLTWSSLNLIQSKKQLSIIVIKHFRSFRCSSSIICSRTNLLR